MKQRGQTPAEDREQGWFEEGVITDVTPYADVREDGELSGWSVSYGDGWVTDPGMVVLEHGALTPLVGCESYGCPHDREAVDA